MTGLLYLTLAVVGIVDPRSAWPWPRGALATVLLLVGAAHVFVADGGADQGWPLLQHVVTPLLVLADIAWQPGAPGRWWWPLTWALVPAAYLGYHRTAELRGLRLPRPVRAPTTVRPWPACSSADARQRISRLRP